LHDRPFEFAARSDVPCALQRIRPGDARRCLAAAGRAGFCRQAGRLELQRPVGLRSPSRLRASQNRSVQQALLPEECAPLLGVEQVALEAGGETDRSSSNANRKIASVRSPSAGLCFPASVACWTGHRARSNRTPHDRRSERKGDGRPMSKRKRLDVARFRVAPDTAVDLDDCPTEVKPLYDSKREYERLLARQTESLRAQQNLLYAYDHYALLLIFQAMDAAGKDGAIKHVMSGVNPQGCQVFSFKHPSATDLDHDFLWRTTQCLPERGRIGIFNRSHYEEVLIVRVHPEILAAQRMPPETVDDEHFWANRYRSINDLEAHLHRSGTRIVKFFLHLSKDEQKKRFLARLDDPDKNWKFSRSDIEERGRWDEYMHAYEQCLSHTSTDHAPWYCVPADDKHNARLIISQVILDTVDGLDMHYPESLLKPKELRSIRKQLEKDG
jgi:PPK2 family polyphosphate:nucleotide phosphotransferase